MRIPPISEWTDSYTIMALAVAALVGFLIGWMIGLRGNKVKPLSRQARAMERIAKVMEADKP